MKAMQYRSRRSSRFAFDMWLGSSKWARILAYVAGVSAVNLPLQG